MAESILKFNLDLNLEPQRFAMSQGADFLNAQLQNGVPQAWFKCDTGKQGAWRRVQLAWTGKTVPKGRYVTTFQTAGGMMVWHVFDLGEETSEG